MKDDQQGIPFIANKKWLSISEETRKKLERNVWCSSCSAVVQIVKYDVKDMRIGIVLEGKCKQCGGDVARVID